MSQHLRTLQPPPFSSVAPTTKLDSFSLSRFSFGLHTSVSPLISISFGCARQTPAVPLSQQGSLQPEEPVFLYLQPISSETHFDHVLLEAQQFDDAIVVVWMANWCRKCIYLKPKLEKLAADYYPRLRFYSVDVNTVSHKLVARAGVTKMPTIQLWKDSKKQTEVIGGHKAYLVINEVQEMIENECTSS
ncbi:thioredoxin-like 3-2, chloroplastic [Abrus precatorius]|uniref:Thioredoxin-like 3-2, chloroplastic n=1 Tax=Abrus precatorius TaxID=3816 RepID=A0A8B8MAX0_ABRPR|nr:thioredoxin-like 3-2, chloroplastic [Abrus precatorius]